MLDLAKGYARDCEAEAKNPPALPAAAPAAAPAPKRPAATAARVAPTASDIVALLGPGAVGGKSGLFAKAGFQFQGAAGPSGAAATGAASATAAGEAGSVAEPSASEQKAVGSGAAAAPAAPAAKRPVRFWGAVAARKAGLSAEGVAAVAAPADGEAGPSPTATEPAPADAAAQPAAVVDAHSTVPNWSEELNVVPRTTGVAGPTTPQLPIQPAAAAAAFSFPSPPAEAAPFASSAVPAWMSSATLKVIADHNRRASVEPRSGVLTNTSEAAGGRSGPTESGVAGSAAGVAEATAQEEDEFGGRLEREYAAIFRELWA